MPFGLTADLDEALHGMERPNVNSGWVAMSPDGRNIVGGVAEGIRLPVRRLIVSHDDRISPPSVFPVQFPLGVTISRCGCSSEKSALIQVI